MTLILPHNEALNCITLCVWSMAAFACAALPDGATTLQGLRDAAAHDPGNVDLKKRLAAKCLEMHLESEALEAATAATAAAPADLEGWALLIRALARSGRYDDALDASRDPRSQSITNELSGTIQSSTHASLAQRRLQEALLSEQRDAFNEVIVHLERALVWDDENLFARKTMGWVYQDKLHQPRAAYPHLVKVVHAHPEDMEAKKLLALASAETGRLHRAADLFRTVLAKEPGDLWMKVNLARTLARLGRWSDAETLYESVLATDKTNYRARLGIAELMAWRGRSSDSERSLRQLVDENPDDPEARTLLGDVRRWNWSLTYSRADYAAVLRRYPDFQEALRGQHALQEAGASFFRAGAYDFTDTEDFTRSSLDGSARVPLCDRVYLLAEGDAWWFKHPAFKTLRRVDGAAGLEWHPARWLEAGGRAGLYDYENRHAFFGGEISSKLSLGSRCDIYTIISFNHPFVSSIATVYQGLREDSVGSGLDIKLGRGFSFQNSFQAAGVSDDNEWLQEKPQLSYQVFNTPAVFVRLEHDFLTYDQRRNNYWTPHNRNVLSPVADVSSKLNDRLQIDVAAKAPYAFDESEFGFQIESGFTCELSQRLRVKASYLYSSIPGDMSPWSGSGWKAYLSCHF